MREVREKLKTDLKGLEHELRIELPKEINTALAMGDLRENAEYHAALERQGFVRARIGQLRERLQELGMIDMTRVPRDRAGMGSRLTVMDLDSDEQQQLHLVLPEVADLAQGKISIASPIGKGLVGSRRGDEITIEIPSGTRRFEILELRTFHDAEAADGSGEKP